MILRPRVDSRLTIWSVQCRRRPPPTVSRPSAKPRQGGDGSTRERKPVSPLRRAQTALAGLAVSIALFSYYSCWTLVLVRRCRDRAKPDGGIAPVAGRAPFSGRLSQPTMGRAAACDNVGASDGVRGRIRGRGRGARRPSAGRSIWTDGPLERPTARPVLYGRRGGSETVFGAVAASLSACASAAGGRSHRSIFLKPGR